MFKVSIPKNLQIPAEFMCLNKKKQLLEYVLLYSCIIMATLTSDKLQFCTLQNAININLRQGYVNLEF